MYNTVEILGSAREAAWLPWAVQYFFLIGTSAAAFFLTLPGLVFGRARWSRVSRQALLVALVCGLTAPVALLSDLHQPGRFLNFYLHPNLRSWMAWGSFFIPLYVAGLLLYAWLCLRPQLAALARAERGVRLAAVYRALAYGGHDNRAAVRLAAVVTALGAVLILLYTGVEVMVIQARALWNTPLVPPLLAATAFAGALGMTALFAAAMRQFDTAPLLTRWIAGSQWLVLALLAAWLASGVAGWSSAAAEVLDAVNGSAGWAMTFAWLVGSSLLTLWLASRSPRRLLLAAVLALHGAWAFRWILFMGGQAIPKMGAAFRTYALTATPDGLLGIVGTAGLFLAIYIGLTSFIQWDEPAGSEGASS
ncbi:NrfD/PsrC family molybdoenzyme membrane anchor subunit [Ramlibacter sp.]|uniref:NrfD/PsrC family molybdoenzyme membrane anchor subunit n=1 Tax=Ramlibacter sp. TaxID=1917967 RepID=UPI002B602F4C|nr:NrfD/PsrC family molybdoenzyme membrane anchor subunit [Ramlibacter sp.]HWI83727.1 NrfD/PsrC family molybdoenzyme membrane anchor subunit [Ramlibacter sp.]